VLYAIIGHTAWAIRIAQALLGSVACAFGARAASGFFSHRVGWIAGFVLAFYPPAIFFDGIIQKASLDLVFMTGLLWTISAAQRTPQAKLLIVAGLLLGAMTLNRENAAILVPLLLVWIVWLSWRESSLKIARNIAAYGLGIALVLLPVGFRNYQVGGQFLLTTSQMGPNFYIGNHAGASGLYEPLRPGRGDPLFESLDARLLAEEAEGKPLSPREISNYWMGRSWHDIQTAPGQWLSLLAHKWFLTWHNYEFVDAESIQAHASDSPLLRMLGWLLHFGTLCPLAVVGLWLTRRDWRRLWILYAMLLAFAFAVTMFFVFARYRYPLVPLAALFAAAGIDGIWQRLREPGLLRFGELAQAVGAAILVAIACNWPLAQLPGDETTYITIGTGLMDDNRPAAAVPVFQKALRINPRSTEALNNLAGANMQLHRYRDAARLYQAAIQLDPRAATPHHGLGEVYQHQRDLESAQREWHRAIELEPFLSEPYRSLGTAHLAQGQPEQAIEYLRKSIELDKSSVRARVDLAQALIATNQIPAAAEQLQIAVGLRPSVLSANNLAWILATAPDERLRNDKEALRLADIACRANDFESPDLLDTLAAANANAGRYDNAVQWVDKAIAIATAEKNSRLASALKTRREAYLAKRPYRDPGLAPAPGSPTR
jgi:tetratricopeptide (TPR) repeat protein